MLACQRSAASFSHALQSYGLLLLDCPVGLLGLAYIALLVWALVAQPHSGWWAERGWGSGSPSAAAGSPVLLAAMRGGAQHPGGWRAASGGCQPSLPFSMMHAYPQRMGLSMQYCQPGSA